MHRNAKCGHNRMTGNRQRKLGKIKRRRFFQVCDRFLKRLSLCSGARFGIERNISTFFNGRQDSGEFHNFLQIKKHSDRRTFPA